MVIAGTLAIKVWESMMTSKGLWLLESEEGSVVDEYVAVWKITIL